MDYSIQVRPNTLTDGSHTYDVIVTVDNLSVTIPCYSGCAAARLRLAIDTAIAQYSV